MPTQTSDSSDEPTDACSNNDNSKLKGSSRLAQHTLAKHTTYLQQMDSYVKATAVQCSNAQPRCVGVFRLLLFLHTTTTTVTAAIERR
ncbi:unnamed protein product [Ceratitis capitata]|uniref:(Mediterranean fruit fly) hypothetical protein n=1 Tax=Ceratitis capitata TaxID=7213 RepID=A0A811V8H5_CERCA|nr:unnamed protein product [Ceratitis capitata]